MPSELNPAEQAVAQYMASQLMHWLGNRTASKMIRCSPSCVWRWGRGYTTPTKAKFRDLQKAYENVRERYRAQTTQFT